MVEYWCAKDESDVGLMGLETEADLLEPGGDLDPSPPPPPPPPPPQPPPPTRKVKVTAKTILQVVSERRTLPIVA